MRRFWVWLLIALTLASATAAPAQIVGGVPLPLLQGPGGCDPRATLELDYSTNLFCSNGQKAGSAAAAISGFSYSRTGAEYEATSSGLLVPFASGVPAITDLGLQVWEARTNAIRNNTMVGAIVSSSLPTNWSPAAASGLTWSVAGLGTELGLPYIDVRLSGTAVGAGASTVRFDAVSTASASASQAWTTSTYSKLAGGSITNVSQSILVGGTSTDGVNVSATFALPNLSLTGSLVRVAGNGTTGASTTNVVSYIQIGTVAGAVDITIRLAGMMLEQASFAGSVIATSGASATRGAASASVGASVPTGDFGVAATLVFPHTAAASEYFWRWYLNSSNQMAVRRGSDGSINLETTVGGVDKAVASAASYGGAITVKTAAVFIGGTMYLYVNGTQIGSIASTLPAATTLWIASNVGTAGWPNAVMPRLLVQPNVSLSQAATLTQ